MLSFLFWQHAPFSFLFLTPGSPTPKVASAPAPTSFPPRRMSGRQSQGGGRHTGGQRTRETWGGVGRGGIQVGRRTEPSDRKGHPQCSKAGEGEPQLGGSSPGGGTRKGWWGGGGSPWSPPALPAALLLEPGAQEGIQCLPQPGSTTEKTRRTPSPSVLALKRVQLSFPKTLGTPPPPRKPTQREGGSVGHRMMERQMGGALGASKSPVGETRQRGKRLGWGGHHRRGRTAGGGTDTLPRSPGGKPEAQFLCPAPPWGPRSWELPSPRLGWAGGQHLGRKGARVRLCSAAKQIQR